MVVIKYLALAKVNHLILSITNPPFEKMNIIKIYFIRTQDYKFGGLRMVELNFFMYKLLG